MKALKILVVIAGLALMGAGCRWFGMGADPDVRNAFRGLSPIEAAEKLQFLPDDQFEIEQRVYGLEALVPGFMRSDENVRRVTVTRFAPMHGANLLWEVEVDAETNESKEAREAYEKALDELTDEDPIPERPETVHERKTTSGTLELINLSTSHKTFFPVYWNEGNQSAAEEYSAMWLSDDAFQELSRTGKTALSFNLFHESSAQAVRGVNNLQEALDTLRNESGAVAKEGREDIDLLEVTDDSAKYDVEIDGNKVTVEAIKAKNWFGEITILKNRQNPMILELSINPLAAGVNELLGQKVGDLQSLFGYKVTKFSLKTY